MYSYRKKIQLSHAATSGFSSINNLSLGGFGTNKIADVEIKATLYDVSNSKASIYYYRQLQIVDPSVTIGAVFSNNSTFSYKETTTTAAYLYDIYYDQTSSTIIIRASNPTGSTLNTSCIIDYKINFY